MSYRTLEVDLENRNVRPRCTETLPAKARALLIIVDADESPPVEKPRRSLADALRGLNVQGRGEYTDLSTNKAHLDDLGR